jgi:hypothetical protein
MNIHRLPSFLKPFFKSFCLELTRPQYAHLWSLLLAMALNLRTSKLVHLTRLLPFSTHRTRHGAFLASDGFDSPRLLRQTVARLIKRFKPLPGETIELILDDHRIAKRGRKMDRLSKIWDHKEQKFVRGGLFPGRGDAAEFASVETQGSERAAISQVDGSGGTDDQRVRGSGGVESPRAVRCVLSQPGGGQGL